MSPDLPQLHSRVAPLAQQQPFAVHWQIRVLVPHPATKDEPGLIGQGADTQVASFSTRKVSLLLACLALVHRGELTLEQRMTITESMKDGVQAGIMKNLAPGVELSLEDHLRQMMITSDNICTQLVFEAIEEVTGDGLQWVNDYCAWVGMRATLHREIFPRSGDLDWHHSIEGMTVTTPADQTHLLALLGQGTHDDDAAGALRLSPPLCRFAVELMHSIWTPLLGARAGLLRFAEKNGRGLRSLSQIGLAAAADGTPVAAVAVCAENIPTQLPDGTPGRLAAYDLFAAVGQAVEEWHVGETSASQGPHAAPESTSGDTAAQRASSAAHSAAAVIDGDTLRPGEGSTQRHGFAGVGKLFAALTLAEHAEGDPALLQIPVTVTAAHRRQAAVGPLRAHTGDLTLSLADAMGLIISTSDAAAALALQDALKAHGFDLVARAQQLTEWLSRDPQLLKNTSITGAEPTPGASGDLLVGETSPEDLVRLLEQAARAGDLAAGADQQDAAQGLSPGAAARVLGWMAQVFEPAGLTYALPGYGPKKVPQWSVSGVELRSASSGVCPQGWSSVMITRPPARAGQTEGLVCAAAHLPASAAESGREAAETFGALGLAAYRGHDLRMT